MLTEPETNGNGVERVGPAGAVEEAADAVRRAGGKGKRLLGRAVKSGLRRYPREIGRSLREVVRVAGKAKGVVEEIAEHIGLGEHGERASVIERVPERGLAACWLGHASVFVGVDGRTVLADPVLSDRIGMAVAGRAIGLGRLAPAPAAAEAFRSVHLILITHAHFDHLDRPTLARLAHEQTEIVVPRRTASLVPRGFGRVTELDSGAVLERDGLRIQAVEPRHWGARAVVDRKRGFNSYVVTSEQSGKRVLLAGDTAETDAFDRVGPVDLAALGIGAYDPWEHMHATPEQAWRMFERMRGRRLMPVHHSTFELSEEPVDEPMRRLLEAAGETGKERLVGLEPGELWVEED